MKTKILFMLLAMPLIFTACSNDDEEEDIPIAGPLSCFLDSEISFYNADGTVCDLEPYADDLYASEMTFSVMLDSSGVAKEYVEDMCLDENTDSIVGDKMYVEMSYLGTLNTIAPKSDVTFYLKMRSAKMFGNEDEHVIRVVLDGLKGLLDEEGFVKSVDSQTLPITWQAEYEKPSLWEPTKMAWDPTLSIRVVLPAW